MLFRSGTQLWSHSLSDVQTDRPQLKWFKIVIADGCYVGARAIIVGAELPRRALVGAGAVVTKDLSAEPPGIVVVGNPATVKR